MYEVFFFGTARSTESKISPRTGILRRIVGSTLIDNGGSIGCESCRKNSAGALEVVLGTTDVEKRSRKEDNIEDVVACTEAIVNCGGSSSCEAQS